MTDKHSPRDPLSEFYLLREREFISYTPLCSLSREQKQKEYILGQRYSNTKTRQRYYRGYVPGHSFKMACPGTILFPLLSYLY